MNNFSSSEVNTLLSSKPFTEEPREQTCPSCGAQSARTYVYRSNRGSRPTLITYTWCATCRKFKGWTGPDLGDLTFSDPLENIAQSERETLTHDLDRLFRFLDELWESGSLPQHFTRIASRRR
ncbi:hypothetical protein [Streptomyces chrestomyceticus]|uniref:hypothetical protein n=1 Tax=Streptomyces chrestomyceticus TaxID=68185 RepID=UPI0037A36CD0